MKDQLPAARALRRTIRATRQQSEEGHRLAPQVVEGLIAGGLFRLSVPASLGGPETELGIALQIYEELAWADASVAWIVWNNQFVGLASRYSSEAVRIEIFSDQRAIFANSTRPSGRAVMADGGFKVSGRWSLVSGCELADWIPVTCVVPRQIRCARSQMASLRRRWSTCRGVHTAFWIPDTSEDFVGPAATILSRTRSSFLRSELFPSVTLLNTIDRFRGCPFLQRSVLVAPHSLWALRRRHATRSWSSRHQRPRSIRFPPRVIGRGCKLWWPPQARSWLPPGCCSTQRWRRCGPPALKE
jgi:acyl-CoA dehydrogenase-like protein